MNTEAKPAAWSSVRRSLLATALALSAWAGCTEVRIEPGICRVGDEPRVLATIAGTSTHLAAYDGALYFLDDEGYKRVDRETGATELLVARPHQANYLAAQRFAVGRGRLVNARASDDCVDGACFELWVFTLATGENHPLGTVGDVRATVIDERGIYVLAAGTTTMELVWLGFDGARETLRELSVVADTALLLGDGELFFRQALDDGTFGLVALDLTTRTTRPVGAPGDAATWLANPVLDGAWIYGLAQIGAADDPYGARLRPERISVVDGELQVLEDASDVSRSFALAVDDERLYFDDHLRGRVMSIAKSGGHAIETHRDVDAAAMVLDDTCLYHVDLGNPSALVRSPKRDAPF